MEQKTIPFEGYSLFAGPLGEFTPKSKTFINTINLHSFVVAESDNEFKQSLLNSDVLLPDGIGAVLGPRFLTGHKVKKTAGANLHHYFLEDFKSKGGKFFYLGSAQSTLTKIEEKLRVNYPGIHVASYSPPYTATFTDEDNQKMIEAVNSFRPDVLFVGMTAPKQEKWVNQHRDALDAGFICPVGAVFDFYAGNTLRPNNFWVGLGLEWFVRLLNEPKRMWRRYLYNGPIFAWMMIKAKFKNKHPQKT